MKSINSIISPMFLGGIISLALFIFSSDQFYNSRLFSLSADALLLLSIVVGLNTICTCLNNRQSGLVLLLILMFFFAMMSSMFDKSGNTVSLYSAVILNCGYVSIPAYMIYVIKTPISRTTVTQMRIVALACSAFFIYRGIFTPTYRDGAHSLTMGYSNPNRTAMYVMLVFILLMLSYDKEERRIKRIIVGIIQVILIYIIVLTECRTAYLICIVCWAYRLIPNLPSVGKRFLRVCLAIPVVFAPIFAFFYNKGWFADAMILDRPIYSGRQDINLSLADFSLLGKFSIDTYGGLNIFVGILRTTGIIGVVLFYAMYSKAFCQLFKWDVRRDVDKNYSAFTMGILLLHGCTETAIFTGGTAYAALMGCILLIIKYNIERN